MPDSKKIRCTKCRVELDYDDIPENVNCCPKCGTKGLPCRVEDDVTIRINIHELRILGIWSENYAVSCDNKHLDDPFYESLKETVNIICREIEKQLIEQGKPTPLTLSGEMKDLKEYLKETGQKGEVDFYRDNREEII
jgi:hypothetical protein